jgi:hypothetical protein
MDTNQETGVSLQDVADLIEQDDQQVESGEDEGAEEVAQSDDSEAPEAEADGAGDDPQWAHRCEGGAGAEVCHDGQSIGSVSPRSPSAVSGNSR